MNTEKSKEKSRERSLVIQILSAIARKRSKTGFITTEIDGWAFKTRSISEFYLPFGIIKTVFILLSP